MKTSICLNCLLFFEGLSESFIGSKTFFLLCIPFSNKKTYIWYNVSCNVWLCMNEMSEHLNSFSIRTCSIPLFRIYYSSSPMCSLRACSSNLLCFYPLFRNTFSPWCLLIVSKFSPLLGVCDSLIYRRKHTRFTSIFRTGL